MTRGRCPFHRSLLLSCNRRHGTPILLAWPEAFLRSPLSFVDFQGHDNGIDIMLPNIYTLAVPRVNILARSKRMVKCQTVGLRYSEYSLHKYVTSSEFDLWRCGV